MDFKGFNRVDLQKAREYAAEIPLKIADEVYTADYYADHVTSEQKEKIRKDNLRIAKDILSGKSDNNFTVRQRMSFYLTGESIALLP